MVMQAQAQFCMMSVVFGFFFFGMLFFITWVWYLKRKLSILKSAVDSGLVNATELKEEL